MGRIVPSTNAKSLTIAVPMYRLKVGEGLSDREKMVLELLEIDPGMTYVAMAEKLDVSEKTI